MRDQSGIAGVDAVFLRGEGLAFQPGEEVILPAVVSAVIDHWGLPVDLCHQRFTEFSEELSQRHDIAVVCLTCISGLRVDACIRNGRVAHHCISNGHVGGCIRSGHVCACWYRDCRSSVLCIRPGRRRAFPGEDDALCAACLFGIDGERRHRPEGQIAAGFYIHGPSRRQHFTQVDITEFREAHAEVAETKGDIILGVDFGEQPLVAAAGQVEVHDRLRVMALFVAMLAIGAQGSEASGAEQVCDIGAGHIAVGRGICRSSGSRIEVVHGVLRFG